MRRSIGSEVNATSPVSKGDATNRCVSSRLSLYCLLRRSPSELGSVSRRPTALRIQIDSRVTSGCSTLGPQETRRPDWRAVQPYRSSSRAIPDHGEQLHTIEVAANPRANAINRQQIFSSDLEVLRQVLPQDCHRTTVPQCKIASSGTSIHGEPIETLAIGAAKDRRQWLQFS